MAEERIKRKNLWSRLGNIKKQQEWLKAAERLNLIVAGGGGKGSHWAIRNSDYPINDIRSLVATIPANLYKQANQNVFKQLLADGIPEDKIWQALGLL